MAWFNINHSFFLQYNISDTAEWKYKVTENVNPKVKYAAFITQMYTSMLVPGLAFLELSGEPLEEQIEVKVDIVQHCSDLEEYIEKEILRLQQ